MLRTITTQTIEKAIITLFIKANFHLEKSAERCLKIIQKSSHETPGGKRVIQQLLQNASISAAEKLPLCQDTGFAIVFLEIGQDIHITGKSLEKAINHAVATIYTQKYLRKSMVKFPATKRINTHDNTPAIVHTSIVPGNKLTITVMPKGGGSENGSALFMLKPGQGIPGIIQHVLQHIKQLGAGICPPVVIGIGIGGTADIACLIAKKALCKPIGKRNTHKEIAALELQLLKKINMIGIGPAGLGGKHTALDVHIETFPTHIACLPVGVAIMCNSVRWQKIII